MSQRKLWTLDLIRASCDIDANGCWLWRGAKNNCGYGVAVHAGKQVKVHRLAWELANGQAMPANLLGCHRCPSRGCCNPAHVYAGTPAENSRDASVLGRYLKRLTPADVLAIRDAKAHGVRQNRIASAFGVTASTVSRVVRGIFCPEVLA